ncbi:phosphoribosylaminoimidazole-succinocarboxamide synthase [Capsaspora owczarzaki ATCC 30864]|uniref:Phosphoribosylaminoimidazole-succinocarboxamide synthase n=1 Tax=Capsaspora owczarzaki (strain ATCC 30864) TaxID=595528 RepID=A0A0D2VS59_CAPO3|nr:phosphoribosylaminoimidazole-succinocarboxamide synthase [Capsaspora owczarzaki ATCC 30864]KJE93877.1 phosphoribosylaminoimidazole-succinocarboxamide synthase [Capsaspora owczarzaki ATCC 30864]|eukprot:XP_004347344.1 phosphoribosylaminoimidazole-succinocarboxamide synthase [Capsaspora owczarzaki ATCC 30864]
MSALVESNLPALTLLARGKVRDVYRIDDKSLLFVATDRISAFDVVMNNGIPGKGKILNQISLFWFDLLKEVVPCHLITAEIDEMPEVVRQYRDQLEGRSMLVRSLNMLPIESIVRGYVAGSGWKEYQQSNTICGIALPAGLTESARLPQALFTPSTKAELGTHDENIHPDKAAEMIGKDLADRMAATALELYTKASEYALTRGIIIADTKFEFGIHPETNALILGDEVLTPDSSRFWPKDKYATGRAQDSYDKQYVRDYLESIKFNKKDPVTLPEDVVQNTLAKYQEVFTILTGRKAAL